MALRVRKVKLSTRRLATAARSFGAFARRPIHIGVLLFVVSVATFAMKSLPSGAETVPTVKAPTLATSPAGTQVASTPKASTLVAQTQPATVIRTPSTAARPRGLVRGVVLGLSQCLSTLGPRSEWMLLMRAGLGSARQAGRRAAARWLKVGTVREAYLESAALHQLQTAAQQGGCGSMPALIHVPARNRLVSIDAVLTDPSPARTVPSAGSPGQRCRSTRAAPASRHASRHQRRLARGRRARSIARCHRAAARRS